jgi:AraC family transcriptional regulator of adaptative response / DNA-3-methyladenine glycosylase II
MNPGLLPVLPQVLAKVRHLFDLQCDPDAVVETLVLLNLIRPGLCVPGIRLPGCFDAFELAVRAVLGQQISIKAANTLSERLVKVYGHPCHMNQDGLTHFFPSASDIIALDGPVENHLGPLGITATRAKAIRYLAEAFSNGHLNISLTGNPDDEIVKLKKIPGIGDWTAQYIAMRGMGWPDAFPKLDHGLIKALAPRKPKDIQLLAESWRPWRSYATISLWYGLSQKSTD